MFLRDFSVSVIVGTLILFFLGRLLGRVSFTWSNSLWGSLLGHITISLLGLVFGLLFHEHLAIALIISFAVGWFVQTVLYQILARTQDQILLGWRAASLSLIVILGDLFVASPLIELWEHLRT